MVGIPLQMAPTAPAPMEYRHIGRSELVGSVIGFGCSPLGGSFGELSEDDALATIRQSLTLGVNCFDTGPLYGFGRADELLGRGLGRWRNEVNVLTSVGHAWNPADPERTVYPDSSPAGILDSVGGLHASLRRLGTDYVDVLLLDATDSKTPIEETMVALVKARDQGKARHIGVSNFTSEQMLSCLPHAPVIVNEVAYNIFDRVPEQDVFETCRMFGIGVVTASTLASGLLTGTLSPEAMDHPPRHVAKSVDFSQQIETIEHLKDIARGHHATLTQLALAWVLRQPAVSVALVGMAQPREVTENLGALSVKLSQEDLTAIDKALGSSDRLTDQPP